VAFYHIIYQSIQYVLVSYYTGNRGMVPWSQAALCASGLDTYCLSHSIEKHLQDCSIRPPTYGTPYWNPYTVLSQPWKRPSMIPLYTQLMIPPFA
jgi:hypothetical protein